MTPCDGQNNHLHLPENVLLLTHRSNTNHKKEITMSELIGNYKDLNGDTVRVTFENRRYYYETVDGTPDRYVSHQGPDSDRTLVRVA